MTTELESPKPATDEQLHEFAGRLAQGGGWTEDDVWPLFARIRLEQAKQAVLVAALLVIGTRDGFQCQDSNCGSFDPENQHADGCRLREALTNTGSLGLELLETMAALTGALAPFADLENWQPIEDLDGNFTRWEFVPGRKLAPNEHPAGYTILPAGEVPRGL